jgi:dipeptidyl aminopeptidase/acylaminoacyl peptidase
MFSSRAGLLIFFLVLPVTIRGETTGDPSTCNSKFSLESMLSSPELAGNEPFRVSPTGEWIAYVLTPRLNQPVSGDEYLANGLPSRSLGNRLLIINPPSGDRRDLCPEGVSCLRPSWSPDGKTIAYYSDEGGKLGLWEVDIKTRLRKMLVADYIKVSRSPGEEPKWSPDGKTLYVLVRSQDSLSKLRAPKAEENLEQFLVHENEGNILAVDRETKTVRPLTSSKQIPAASLIRLSSDGTRIAYLSAPQPRAKDDLFEFQLAVINKNGGSVKTVADKMSSSIGEYGVSSYAWHPSEEALLFIKEGKLWKLDFSKEPSGLITRVLPEVENLSDLPLAFSTDGKMVLVGMNGTKNSPLSIAKVGRISFGNPTKVETVPLGSEQTFKDFVPGDRGTFLTNDNFEFIIKVAEKGTEKIIGYQRKKGGFITLHEGGRIGFAPQPPLGNKLVARFENLSHPDELYLFDTQFDSEKAITHTRAILGGMPKPTLKKITTSIKLPNGNTQNVTTALLLPGGLEPGQRPPTVVIGYPGSDLSLRTDTYAGGNPTATVPSEALLRKGYAVALVNLPIGPQGKAGEPVKELVQVLLPQLDSLSKSGDVNPDRFALMGLSHGGYFAVAVPTQLPPSYKNKIKAAISISGIYDLAEDYKLLPREMVKGQGRMGSPPLQDPERYARNSPNQNVDKISTPILILQGTKDPGYPQAQEFTRRLKELGKNVTLSSYEGEGHVPLFWTMKNHLHAVETALDFLDRELGPGICPKVSGVSDATSNIQHE